MIRQGAIYVCHCDYSSSQDFLSHGSRYSVVSTTCSSYGSLVILKGEPTVTGTTACVPNGGIVPIDIFFHIMEETR